MRIISKTKRILRNAASYRGFIKDFIKFRDMAKKSPGRFMPLWKNRRPCLADKTKDTPFDAHYILHPAWAARVLARTKPEKHVDISSTLTFGTMLSAFIPVDFYDYRPAALNLSGLTSKQADLLALPFANNSIPSLSCMHTIEHVGLGRYGDPINPDDDLRAIEELKRVTAIGGTLLFVVPIGKEKIVFNAHRIYSYDQIIGYFKNFELKEFSLIPDDVRQKGFQYNATKEMADNQRYGCGCFWFIKK